MPPDSGLNTNGRLQNGTTTYDAAGDLLYYQKTDDLHNHQKGVFDAAGRQVTYFDFRDSANIVTQRKQEYVFDGDGHPVIEKLGSRVDAICCVGAEPSTTTHGYQVWSTVLGSSLTSLYASGYKKETRVFAGGMTIATQGSGDGGGSDTVVWILADPVTGTSAGIGSTGGNIVDEREPFGQTIQLTDPGVPPPPATLPVAHESGDGRRDEFANVECSNEPHRPGTGRREYRRCRPLRERRPRRPQRRQPGGHRLSRSRTSPRLGRQHPSVLQRQRSTCRLRLGVSPPRSGSDRLSIRAKRKGIVL